MSPIYFIVYFHVVAYYIVFDQTPKSCRALFFTVPGEALDSEALNYPASAEAICNARTKTRKTTMYNCFTVQRQRVAVEDALRKQCFRARSKIRLVLKMFLVS
jgi:hypothetical protein